jgi:hypothetical protein
VAVLEDPPVRPGVADQSQVRATVPAAEAHDDHDHDGNDEHEGEHAFAWPEAARIAFVTLAAAAVWFRVWEPLVNVTVIGVLGVIVGGWPIFKEAADRAWQKVKKVMDARRPRETLMPSRTSATSTNSVMTRAVKNSPIAAAATIAMLMESSMVIRRATMFFGSPRRRGARCRYRRSQSWRRGARQSGRSRAG